ncbi:MAG: hypothetical protein ACKVOA_08820 [Methylophilaceae bacterium]
MASADAAKKFQNMVPHVFVPTKLFCQRFDDIYLADSAEFMNSFSLVEHGAIKTLNVSIEKLSIEEGDPPPSIEELVTLPSWSEVEVNAKKLLGTLNAYPYRCNITHDFPSHFD